MVEFDCRDDIGYSHEHAALIQLSCCHVPSVISSTSPLSPKHLSGASVPISQVAAGGTHCVNFQVGVPGSPSTIFHDSAGLSEGERRQKKSQQNRRERKREEREESEERRGQRSRLTGVVG